ncbi:hypothetical protein [Nocardia sp. NPDC051750]|uniref:hypothetical protein n=1 Tax=Nocardia sp. NPDC051750 TaxID=3364325 RepID=UPI0037B2A2ED
MAVGAQRAGRWTRWLPAGYSLLLTLLITAPLLPAGYLLLRDAVSTPRSYFTDTALGLGDAAPRAVPQDALLATLSPIVDGGLLVKAILLIALWAAGFGAAVLVRDLLRAPLAAQLVATTLAVWNPYVAERLLQGHWSLLTGYAALPWTVLAALRIRTRLPEIPLRRVRTDSTGNADQPPHLPSEAPRPAKPLEDLDPSPTGRAQRRRRVLRAPARGSAPRTQHWAALAGCLAAAGLTPTGALLAGIVAVVVIGRRWLVRVLALVALACTPWLMATAVSGVAAEPSDPAGVPAFAARAEPGLGTLGSLAGLGGIWNADAVPGSRTTPLAAIATILFLAVVVLGIRTVAAADGDPERTRARRILLVLALAAIALPALAATPAGLTLMEWLVVHIPGAGLLRDTQKFVALAVPAYTLCAAAACSVFAGRHGLPASARPTAGPADFMTPMTPAAPRLTDRPAAAADPAAELDSEFGESAGDARHSATAPDSPTAPSPDAGGHRLMRVSPALAALLIGMLVLPLPDLGWGVGGQMQAVHYPDSWSEVAERIDGPGDIAVLPGGMFRRFPYSGSAPVLDPAPRMLPRDVLQTGELPVRGRIVAGEGGRAHKVEDLLLAGGEASELARLGVGWVLVERDTPGPMGESATTLARLDQVLTTDELILYRVPEVRPRPAPEHRALVLSAHILWAFLLVSPVLTVLLGYLSRNCRRAPRPV